MAHNESQELKLCLEQPHALYFLLSSLVSFFGGIGIILLIRIVRYFVAKTQHKYRMKNIIHTVFGPNAHHLESKENCGYPDDVDDSACSCERERKDSQISENQINEDEIHSIIEKTLRHRICHKNWGRIFKNITSKVHKHSINLVSYQYLSGRIFIKLSMLLSIGSFIMYAFEISRYKDTEKCDHGGRRMRRVDFVFNLFFLFHFLIRWLAASDTLSFWLDGFSIVDFCTVPPAVYGFAFNRSWTGLRFMRIFRLVHLAEICNNLNLIRNASHLRILQFLTFFIALWFAGAGAFHLIENTFYQKNTNSTNEFDIIDELLELNDENLSYMTCLYFTVVTMSTVGYGDVTPRTKFGQIFTVVFILSSLAAFTKIVPEIAEVIMQFNKYGGSFEKEAGRSHVVVCGDVRPESVRNFLEDFLHKDRKRSDVEVVFINQKTPDLIMRSLLRRHFSRVKYFQGTVMNVTDLDRVKMEEADSCIILANTQCMSNEEEDAANIMRVIAVKNFSAKTRVIVQLLKYSSKAYLLNIPGWSWYNGDEIICFSELKLGFLAQSCIAPGFSTLLTNLFSMRSLHGLEDAAEAVYKLQRLKGPPPETSSIKRERPKETEVNNPDNPQLTPLIVFKSGTQSPEPPNSPQPSNHGIFHGRNFSQIFERAGMNHKGSNKTSSWRHNYLRGLTNEIYSAEFSSAFWGLTFVEAAVLAKSRLELMLIAVVAEASHTNHRMFHQLIESDHPGAKHSDEDTDEERPLCEEMAGFAHRQALSRHYLAICPVDQNSEQSVIIKPSTSGFFICDSQILAQRASKYCVKCHDSGTIPGESRILRAKFLARVDQVPCKCRKKQLRSTKIRRNSAIFVSTNTSNLLKSTEASHVPVQVLTSFNVSEDSKMKEDKNTYDVTGMYHWCAPMPIEKALLKSSQSAKRMPSWTRDVLRNHIILCILAKKDAPSLGLCSFVMPLRTSNLELSKLKPIILMGNTEYIAKEWSTISSLPKVYVMPASPFSRIDLRLVRVHFCSVCVIVSSRHQSKPEDPFMIDKEAILCSLNIRGMKFSALEVGKEANKLDFPPRLSGNEIPIITELYNDGNVHYLDSEDLQFGNSSELQVYMTSSFAMGIAFTSSVLDALASTAYFDRNTMTIIRHFVTGGITPVLEQVISEGEDTNYTMNSIDQTTQKLTFAEQYLINQNQKRPRIDQIALINSAFKDFYKPDEILTFGELFSYSLEKLGILCIGLFRLKRPFQYNTDPLKKPYIQLRRISTFKEPFEEIMEERTMHNQEINREKLLDVTYTTEGEIKQSIVERYVITNPHYGHVLNKTDLIYIICPSDFC